MTKRIEPKPGDWVLLKGGCVRHLGNINLRLGRIESGIGGLRSGIGGVKTGIQAMDSHMGGHFERLDKKFDCFGSILAQVADDIHQNKGGLRKRSVRRRPSNP